MRNDYLKDFNNKYKNINVMIENNIESLTDYQQKRLIDDLERIVNNIKDKKIYRSDFKSLQVILKDIQFYQFLESRGIN